MPILSVFFGMIVRMWHDALNLCNEMKEQIMTLLDEWKEKQPPELAKAPKKMEQDK